MADQVDRCRVVFRRVDVLLPSVSSFSSNTRREADETCKIGENQMPGQDMRDIEQYVADRVSRNSACATRVTFLCNSGAGADLGEEYEVNIILALISSNQKPSGVRPPHWQGHQKIGASRLDILDSSSNSSRYRGKTKHARLEQRDAKRYLSTY